MADGPPSFVTREGTGGSTLGVPSRSRCERREEVDRAGEPARGVAALLRIRMPLELPGRACSEGGTEVMGEADEEVRLERGIATEAVEELAPPVGVGDATEGISSELLELVYEDT